MLSFFVLFLLVVSHLDVIYVLMDHFTIPLVVRFSFGSKNKREKRKKKNFFTS